MSLVLLLVKNGKIYDASQLVSKLVWSGRKGTPARSVSVTLIDTDDIKSGVDCCNGDSLIFSYDGKELFRGIIMSQSQSDKETMEIKAYDSGIYLSNNRDTFNYTGKTASEIFRDVCKRFDMKTGKIAEAKYKMQVIRLLRWHRA